MAQTKYSNSKLMDKYTYIISTFFLIRILNLLDIHRCYGIAFKNFYFYFEPYRKYDNDIDAGYY